jgi:proteasome assembly chaperone (PAC2) family protein
MNELYKIYARPKLNTPNLLAAWPGVGNVSIILATYLTTKLNFKDLALINPVYFFDPTGVLVEDSIIEAPQFPQSRFYYRKNDDKNKSDLILFIGDDQPVSKGYDLPIVL